MFEGNLFTGGQQQSQQQSLFNPTPTKPPQNKPYKYTHSHSRKGKQRKDDRIS
jgi:hypothetical protein